MKKNDLYQAAQAIKPDAHLKKRLAAKVANPPERAWRRTVGTLAAACMLFAVIGVSVMYMQGYIGGRDGGDPTEEIVLSPGTGTVTAVSPEPSGGADPAPSADPSDAAASPESEREVPRETVTYTESLLALIKPYEPFGVSVDEATGLMMYEGRPVREIFDTFTGVIITESIGPNGFGGKDVPGAVDLTPLYEDGVLVGMKASTQEEYDARTEERRRNVESLDD